MVKHRSSAVSSRYEIGRRGQTDRESVDDDARPRHGEGTSDRLPRRGPEAGTRSTDGTEWSFRVVWGHGVGWYWRCGS